MSPGSQKVSPSTPIRRAAPIGTAKILAPTTERQPFSPALGYAQPGQVSPTTPSHTTPKNEFGSVSSSKKTAGGKNKKKAVKIDVDFSVRAPSDEELYGESTEAPPDVDDDTKEEYLSREFDKDGVESRFDNVKVDAPRPGDRVRRRDM